MYEFVSYAETKRYRAACSAILKDACAILRSEKDISCEFTLVGSGARNMVTRNGDGPYDLDYNIQINSMPETFWNNLANLKETVRHALNEAVRGTFFSDGHDSTSVLTSLLHFDDEPSVFFSFDVAILAHNEKGEWCRLIHNKHAQGFGQSGQYTWCQVPSSKSVYSRAKGIRNAGEWEKVRRKYLEHKNRYLQRGDTDHPSFVCYVEAVNVIYRRLFEKGGKKR